ncbi:hypothetical protein PV325_006652 [Microctonus aethiopoides]|nr:hypothetical protein PV325_006652 [Microctonus aethiopoides]KAK0083700.1 hypothetical protein PV326_006613 [Microctonus aethiopoides]
MVFPAKITSAAEDLDGMKGLLKWKGVMFVPNVDSDSKTRFQSPECGLPWHDCEVFMVELTRGWNSRLGFSLHSRDNFTVISMVHPDSVAAKDGRLKRGDVLIMIEHYVSKSQHLKVVGFQKSLNFEAVIRH